MSAFTFLPLGAIIQEFKINGRNIVQGFDTAEQYKKYNGPFFGETIGRIANRVSGAKIQLNGKTYQLAVNNGPNSLHGGNEGWGKKEFQGPTQVQRNGKDAVLFTYTSKDGEEAYPGTVEVRVWYTQEKQDGKEILTIEYEAELVGDEVEETVVAMTNHSYFNLSDLASNIAGTEVTLVTNKYQVVDDGGIPTGPIEAYPGVSPNTAFTLGEKEPDIDDCFVNNEDPSSVPIDTRSSPLVTQASFFHPQTKIHLEVASTEPAFQFYTGKYIDVPAVDGLPARRARAGFCVEPSRYVNAINVPEYRNMVVLKKGEKYGSVIVYRGWEA